MTVGAFGDHAGWVAGFWAGKEREFLLGFTIIEHNAMHLGEAWVTRGLTGAPSR